MIRVLLVKMGNYRKALAGFIENQILEQKKLITFIDSMNCLDQYMFRKKSINHILDRLYYSRTEKFYDFITRIESIHSSHCFRKSNMLLLSPFAHLFSSVKEYEKRFYSSKAKLMMENISNDKEVILFSIKDGAHNSG